MSADKYTLETVLSLQHWTPTLFSFRTTRSAAFRFNAGQFVRLGLQKGDRPVWRAFSMVSSPYEEFLEFFAIVAPQGDFSSELARIQPGERLMVDKSAFGFLTLERFQGGRDLWLLASGTGVAPYLSMLRTPEVWLQYENIILVYSVRVAAELAYLDEIHALAAAMDPEKPARLTFVPVVTRETLEGCLSQRITQLLQDGALELAAARAIDAQRARLMICGNPQMVADTRQILQQRGLTLSRLSAPGHLAMEQFW
jgi:ferredoxin--NADP+ reductase